MLPIERAQPTRILGIDPGSVKTGYGFLVSDGVKSQHLAHGHLALGSGELPPRLGKIFQQLTELIQQWQPQEMAVEQVFVSNNAMSALKLGQARGAAICAGVAAGLPVFEYTPKMVKLAVVGSGAADKAQMQHMVGLLLNLTPPLQEDAADALGVAICHAHSRNRPLHVPTRKRRSRRWR